MDPVFREWKGKGVNHSLSVLFFTRTFFPSHLLIPHLLRGFHNDTKLQYDESDIPTSHPHPPPSSSSSSIPIQLSREEEVWLQETYPTFQKYNDDLFYEDSYRLAIENESSGKMDEGSMKRKLRLEFYRFSIDVGWNLKIPSSYLSNTFFDGQDISSINQNLQNEENEDGENNDGSLEYGQDLNGINNRDPHILHSSTLPVIPSIPSSSKQGNLLEAINATLNVQDKHYMDRDLERTGNSMVVITPGTGVFNVEKDLMETTEQRMMDNGIGVQLISLSNLPFIMHPLSLMSFRREDFQIGYPSVLWMVLFIMMMGMKMTREI